MHIMISRLFIVALALAAASAGAQELVVAAARLQFSLPFYVAETEGYFVEEGVKIRVEDCNFGRICLKRLLDGEAQLATVADTPLVLASHSSSAFFILATIGESPNDSKLVVRKSAGIAAPKDLAGKRIGTITGTSAQYFLDTYLLYNAVDRREVTVISVSPDRAAAAIAGREVDALAVFEPYAYAAAKLLGADGGAMPSGRINRTTFNLAIDRRIAGSRDADLVKLLRALDRAVRFIHEQPKKAQTILRNRLNWDRDFVDWVWKDYEFELSLGQYLIAVLESQARWAAREGYAAGASSPNYLNYLYTEPLARLRPAAVSIVK